MKLSAAQRDALCVLVTIYPDCARGGKRRSSTSPVPHVNTRAAESLVDRGLARMFTLPYAGVFSSGFEYKATQAGVEELAPLSYPEHEKLQAVKEHSQAIGEFLDFGLPKMGIHLCTVDEETDRWFPAHRSIQSMLAEYFGIDQNRLEEEKRAMLEAMRA